MVRVIEWSQTRYIYLQTWESYNKNKILRKNHLKIRLPLTDNKIKLHFLQSKFLTCDKRVEYVDSSHT